jgi:hypothetical protein
MKPRALASVFFLSCIALALGEYTTSELVALTNEGGGLIRKRIPETMFDYLHSFLSGLHFLSLYLSFPRLLHS